MRASSSTPSDSARCIRRSPPCWRPTFVGAYVGSDEKLPTWQMAFKDPRAREAKELMVRLLREKAAYETLVFPDNNFLVSAAVFPLFLRTGGRPQSPAGAQGRRTLRILAARQSTRFCIVQKHGPISKQRLRESLGGDISEAALDRALDELWAKLRITRVDYKHDEGVFWDVLFRWSPEAVKEGMHLSVPESLTALVSKYVDCVQAVAQEDVENFFSPLVGRAQGARRHQRACRPRASSASSTSADASCCRPPNSALPHKPRERRTNHGPRRILPSVRPGKPLVERRAAPRNRPARTTASRRQQGMSRRAQLVIAIDGPAGSGKSTIAARLAKKLGYINLESGAMYRALALKALEQQVSLEDPEALRNLAINTVIDLEPQPDGNRVLLDGRDVSQRIRESDVTLAASRVSIHPPVRQIMVARQRAMGANGGVVMEGRDIGTAVFPNADVKVFLDADARVRAERRVAQNGTHTPEEAQRIIEELVARDQRDRTRAVSPLVPAADAVIIDSTNLSIDDAVSRVEQLVHQRLSS